MTNDFEQVLAEQRQQVCAAILQTTLGPLLALELRPHLPLVVAGRLVHDALTRDHGPSAVTRFFSVLFPRLAELDLGPLQSPFVSVRSLEQAVLGGIAREVLASRSAGPGTPAKGAAAEERVLRGARRGFAQYLEDAWSQRLLSRDLYEALLGVAGLEAPLLSGPRVLM